MRIGLRALVMVTAALMAAVTGASPGEGGIAVARADEDPPLQVGTTLVARSDCELQKVVIARGSKLQVTAFGAKTADVVLPDGYVLKRIPLSRIRFFFDVVR